MIVIGLAGWLALNAMIAIEISMRLDKRLRAWPRRPVTVSSLPLDAGRAHTPQG